MIYSQQSCLATTVSAMPAGLFSKLVKERPKSPAEVLAKAVAALQALSARDSNPLSTGAKEQAQVHKYLGYLKFFLFGDEQGGGHDPTKESVMNLVNEVVKTDFQLLLVENLVHLEFEARKDAAQVFGAIVRIRDDAMDPACPGALYVLRHQSILRILFEGWVSPGLVAEPVSSCAGVIPSVLADCCPGVDTSNFLNMSLHCAWLCLISPASGCNSCTEGRSRMVTQAARATPSAVSICSCQ